jgi:hypothetical protein
LIFRDEDVLVSIRYIDFPNWKINEPIEIYIDKNTTFLEFADLIVKHYPNLIVKSINIRFII